jgi:methionine-rich copper-binding protein CopC
LGTFFLMKASRCGLAIAGSALLLAIAVPAASAHAALKSASPSPKSSVAAPPSEVETTFTERIEGGSLEVYDPCGERVDVGEEDVLLDSMSVAVSADKQGAYTVVWSVISGDSHPVDGSFWFESSGGAACPGSDDPDPDPKPGGNGGDDDPGNGGKDGGNSEGNQDSGDPGSDGTDGAAPDERGNTPGGRGGGDDNSGDRSNVGRSGDGDRDGGGSGSVRAAPRAPDAPADSEGIPLGGLLLALAIAALIGGAGGIVYAGIVSPRS